MISLITTCSALVKSERELRVQQIDVSRRKDLFILNLGWGVNL
tara:strand:- start:410 stop:538 length:129 start_codon:yes stop_codon:yes gene_type:complete